MATAGHARVMLAWQAVDGATGYRIFRAIEGVWGTTPIGAVTGLAYTNGGLANGTPYSYRVAAYTKGGNGPFSSEVTATPMAPPLGLTAAAGDQQVALSWQPSAGALAYSVYRSTSSLLATFVPVATDVVSTGFVDIGLTNGTTYFYRVRAHAAGGVSALSSKVYAKPVPPPPASAPANLVAVPGNARVTLTWEAVANATAYRIFRSTTGTFDPKPIAKVTTLTFKNGGLVNGTAYSYRVTAYNLGGDGPFSEIAATPVAAPPAPTGVTATAGDRQVTVAWTLVHEATTYNVFRSTTPGRAGTLVASGLTATPFVDNGVENGPTYYYTISAINAGGQSPRSLEASATPEGPALGVDPETLAAFRLLRQSTWGPRPGDVEHVKTVGAAAFLSEQLGAPPSIYPATLFNQPIEASQEYFMNLALTGSDQLRQRVAWALHKIWVVSAVEVDSPSGIVTYHQALLNGAFGNYRDLMRTMTLNPAMGSYLNMLNNRSQQVSGVPPNENYARELMQLFTIGIPQLNPNGTPILDEAGAPRPAYTEADVKALARILTGWTFGDGSATTIPRRLAEDNFRVPMEAVPAYHDTGEKLFLGRTFNPGQSASDDLEQALTALFDHPNMAPFVSRQLIQQLVTSNPSSTYVADIAAVFSSSRGDLMSVVRAILLHDEASVTSPTSGKLAEPVLFVVSMLRGFDARVTDHPFMSDKTEEMGQKVFYPPSVFSYFSPGYRVRGTAAPGGLPLVGPEFQTFTSVTSMVRANFAAYLLAGYFGSDAAFDRTPFTSRARDAAALVDYCNLTFMGGRLSLAERNEIVAAVRVTPVENVGERSRTALYLTLVIAGSQVDR
jgi:uncharacterized protein (DUF1800 family)/fibronectin type 3 domain-containing protein